MDKLFVSIDVNFTLFVAVLISFYSHLMVTWCRKWAFKYLLFHQTTCELKRGDCIRPYKMFKA